MGMMFIQSLIIDYSKNEDSVSWTGKILYNVYSSFGILPVNFFFFTLTILIFHSEKTSNSKEKIRFRGIKFVIYFLMIFAIIRSIIRWG